MYKMKIVLVQRVVPHYRIDLFNLINKKLKLSNIEFKIFCGKNIKNTKYKNAEILPNYIFSILRGNRFYERSIKIYFNLFYKLLKEKPDLIVTEGGANTINNLQVYLYSKLFKKTYIVWDLGKFAALREKRNSFVELVYSKIYKLIINNSKNIITYNTQGLKYFQNEFKFDASKIQILYNTINEDKVFDAKKHVVIDRDCEMFCNHFDHLIIYVGAIDYQKNLDFLIRIQENLDKNYGFLIIGDGIYKNELLIKMDPQRTFFTGQITDLNRLAYYYNKSKVFLLPGLGGLSINQSLAFGVPVICSQADGSEFDLIKEGITGNILPKNQTQVWIDKLIEICKSPKTYYEFNCVDHIRQNFTLENAANNFIKAVEL